MKKRRLMALLLSVCVGVSMLPMMAFADDGAAGEATPTAEDETKPTPTDAKYFKYKKDQYGGYEITSYKGTAATVVIPATIKGVEVKTVSLYGDSDKYDDCFERIRTLIIPEGVWDVNLNYSYMKRIALPESACSIEAYGSNKPVMDCVCGSDAEEWALIHDIPLAAGTSTKIIKRATLKESGKVVNTCKKCGISKTAKIRRVSDIFIGGNFGLKEYNGKVKNASIRVSDAESYLKKGTDYTVKVPAGRKKIGIYYYTVTLKGKYSGTKKLAMTIAPKKTKITKISRGKHSITVKWKKQRSHTDGYQIKYYSSKMKKPKVITIKNTKKTSVKIKKLKRKTNYSIIVRTYKNVKGKKIGITGKAGSRKVKTK